MTLLLVFVGCLFTIFALWLTIAPFVGADRGLRLEHLDEEVREIEQLVARRQVLLTSLRELDFDRETEKIAVDDYERFRKRYEVEAVSIMRRLDEIHGGRDWQQKVEQQLTERLGHAPQLSGVVRDEEEVEDEADDAAEVHATDDIDVDDVDRVVESADETHEEASEAEEEAEAATVVDLDDAAHERCASCDTILASDDRFCSQCGTPVTPSEPEKPATSEASA